MKNSLGRKFLQACCLLATGLGANQVLQAQPQYNQGYGDFPPSTIDQQLQGNPNVGSQPPQYQSRDNRGSNPWGNNYPPAQYPPQNYSPQNYPPQNYPPQGYPPQYYGGSPYGGTPGFSGPWGNRGSGFNGPWDNRGSNFSGPWNNSGSGFSPWGGRGGRDPFGNRGPGDWFDPSKGAQSRNWDDMLNAPSRMGEMPGGWTAPSVSVPNPIDVGDEFSEAAKDAPDQMDNFNWNNNRGGRRW